MRRIGEIAAKLINDPKRLVAAANQGPRKFDAPTPSRMEAEEKQGRARETGGTHAEAQRLTPRATETKKAGKPFGGDSLPASMGQRHEGGTARLSYWSGIAPDLRLVIDNKDMGRATPTRPPRAARPISLVLVRGGHAASGSRIVSSLRN